MKIYNIFAFNLIQKKIIDQLNNQINKLLTFTIISSKKKKKVENVFDIRSY